MIIFALGTDVPYLISDKTDTMQSCWRSILVSPQAPLSSVLSGCRWLMMLVQASFARVMVVRSISMSLCPWKLGVIKGRMEITIIIVIIIMLPEHSDNSLTFFP